MHANERPVQMAGQHASGPRATPTRAERTRKSPFAPDALALQCKASLCWPVCLLSPSRLESSRADRLSDHLRTAARIVSGRQAAASQPAGRAELHGAELSCELNEELRKRASESNHLKARRRPISLDDYFYCNALAGPSGANSLSAQLGSGGGGGGGGEIIRARCEQPTLAPANQQLCSSRVQLVGRQASEPASKAEARAQADTSKVRPTRPAGHLQTATNQQVPE